MERKREEGKEVDRKWTGHPSCRDFDPEKTTADGTYNMADREGVGM